MNWQEAKTNTLNVWLSIRDAIGEAESLDLLVEINAICDLCELAKQEADGQWGRCQYCPAYQQFGGCQQVCARLSEMVVDQKWDELNDEVESFIEKLSAMEVPTGSQHAHDVVAMS